ncbi:MAG: hypothetical protein IPG00_21530 [Saprospiraceae bacterium]|nr:hypothetical protein [Saprospiraceae bacterium]
MDILKSTYKNALSLKETMQNSLNEENIAGKYASYPIFLRKYSQLRDGLENILDLSITDKFNQELIPNPFDQTWPQQKQIFEMILVNLNLLISRIETELDLKKDKLDELKHFLQSNIRKAAIQEPNQEKDVQDIIETLLIGKGMEKGIDYDREVGRVKISSKEVIPDFNLDKINLALEVKYTDNNTKTKSIIDQINADILSYSKRYKFIFSLSMTREQ